MRTVIYGLALTFGLAAQTSAQAPTHRSTNWRSPVTTEMIQARTAPATPVAFTDSANSTMAPAASSRTVKNAAMGAAIGFTVGALVGIIIVESTTNDPASWVTLGAFVYGIPGAALGAVAGVIFGPDEH